MRDIDGKEPTTLSDIFHEACVQAYVNLFALMTKADPEIAAALDGAFTEFVQTMMELDKRDQDSGLQGVKRVIPNNKFVQLLDSARPLPDSTNSTGEDDETDTFLDEMDALEESIRSNRPLVVAFVELATKISTGEDRDELEDLICIGLQWFLEGNKRLPDPKDPNDVREVLNNLKRNFELGIPPQDRAAKPTVGDLREIFMRKYGRALTSEARDSIDAYDAWKYESKNAN